MPLCCKISDMNFVEFLRNESSSSELDDSGGDNVLCLHNEADTSTVDLSLHKDWYLSLMHVNSLQYCFQEKAQRRGF